MESTNNWKLHKETISYNKALFRIETKDGEPHGAAWPLIALMLLPWLEGFLASG